MGSLLARTMVGVVLRRSAHAAVGSVIDEAVGRGHRRDPVVGRTGGPAGNARLTSWIGLMLLCLIAAELVTLLDVTGLIRWHVGVGLALVALALLKTASTGWRFLRYYLRTPTYVTAGPPPILLRMLGPLVMVATLGVLGSGTALIAIGPEATRWPLFALLGHRVSPLTIHQGFFLAFGVFTAAHLLARFLPAVALAAGRFRLGTAPVPVPGGLARAAVILGTAIAAVAAIAVVVPVVHGWHHSAHHVHTDFDKPSRALAKFVASRRSNR